MRYIIVVLLILIAIALMTGCKTIPINQEPMEPCYGGDICYA